VGGEGVNQQWLYPGLDLSAKVELAIDRLRENEPPGGYWGCFSGGKDSVVIKHLAGLAGVAVTWHYNVTTIDPPELIYFIREYHPDVIWERPEKNFFALAEKRGFPTRRARWCCEEYKESQSPEGSVLILGVRGAESPRRANIWSVLTYHRKTKTNAVAPIVDWTDLDVWEFITDRQLAYCFLYDEGWERLGCIGCPMSRASERKRDFERWPRFEALWKRLFQRVWKRRTGTLQRDKREWFGDRFFDSWEEMWEWWLNDVPLPKQDDECQGSLEFWS